MLKVIRRALALARVRLLEVERDNLWESLLTRRAPSEREALHRMLTLNSEKLAAARARYTAFLRPGDRPIWGDA